MSIRSPSSEPFNVVIAGGSVAALEAVLALGDLAGYRIRTTLIAPDAEFVYRPMTVQEPFAYASAQRYPLSEIVADIGAKLVADSLTIVDARKRVVHTTAKSQYPYDALILALGARPRARYAHGVTLDDARLDELMHGLIQDVEAGYVGRLAFVIPGRMAWPLPIYELALMTAARAYEMSIELQSSSNPRSSRPKTPRWRSSEAGVSRVASSSPQAIVSRLIASSHFPSSTDPRCWVSPMPTRVPPGGSTSQGARLERVYAAGNSTDFAIKHGGIASQQADAAAQAIAALAGVQIRPEPSGL